MGHKVHPIGFRLGIVHDWQSKWFAAKGYDALLFEDLKVRRHIEGNMRDAGISRVEIDRNANMLTVTIHTAKPGIVIGRGGAKVDETRGDLESLTGKKVRVNIQEIRQPELDARLVAQSIADQLERRVAFRRALRQTVGRVMGRGALGCKAMVAGRLGGAEMSRRESVMDGRVPLHTLRADIDFGRAEAHTTFGRIGVKVWIYKGEVIDERHRAVEQAPEAARPPAPKAPAAEAAAGAGPIEIPLPQPEGAQPPAVAPEPPATVETPAQPESPPLPEALAAETKDAPAADATAGAATE